MKSVVRYEKHGRLASEMNQNSAAMQEYFVNCGKLLEGYILRGAKVAPAPLH